MYTYTRLFVQKIVELFVLFSVMSVLNSSFKAIHPLMLGMGLLMLLVGMSTVIMFYGGLFSFCLFMVMVGGVLVVFSYSISLIPFFYDSMDYKYKEKSKVGLKIFLITIFSFMFLTTVGFESDWSEYAMFSSMMYYSYDWSVAVVWMGFLLFLVMVFSVSIAGKFQGALLK